VTGGSVLGWVVLGGALVAGVVVFDVEIGGVVADVESSLAACLRVRRRFFLVGVASLRTGGGWTGVLALA
jgi:hypothetical protein